MRESSCRPVFPDKKSNCESSAGELCWYFSGEASVRLASKSEGAACWEIQDFFSGKLDQLELPDYFKRVTALIVRFGPFTTSSESESATEAFLLVS